MRKPAMSNSGKIRPMLAKQHATMLYNTGKTAGSFPGHHRPGLIEAGVRHPRLCRGCLTFFDRKT